MKILHYINNLGSGGAEKLLTEILPLIKQKGHEVTLVISNSKMNVEKYENILNKLNIKIINLNTSFYNPYQIMLLARLIVKGNYDIVHSHLFPSQYWLALASFFLPSNVIFIKTEHSNSNKRRKYFALRFLESFIYKRYHAIIAISENVKMNLDNWLTDHNNIIVIHNGVNINSLRNEEQYPTELLSKEFVNILMVGRFDGFIKDQMTLVKTMKFLPENYKLYFAGDGPKLEDIKIKVSELKLDHKLVFLGFKENIYGFMKGADFNILSTNYEGLSGVALESLASGKPFLGSDVIGVKDVVPDQSFLFKKGDALTLAKKIREISDNKSLKDELISKANSHVIRFDINIMTKKYLNLYDSLLRNE